VKAFKVNPKTKPRKFVLELFKEVYNDGINSYKKSSTVKSIKTDVNVRFCGTESPMSKYLRSIGISVYDKGKSVRVPTKVIHQYRTWGGFKYSELDCEVDFNRKYLNDGDLSNLKISLSYDTMNKNMVVGNEIIMEFKTDEHSIVPAFASFNLTHGATRKIVDSEITIYDVQPKDITNVTIQYGYYNDSNKEFKQFNSIAYDKFILHNLNDIALIQYSTKTKQRFFISYFINNVYYDESKFNAHNDVLEYKLNRLDC